MTVLLKSFVVDEAGNVALEYAILASLLSVLIATGMSAATAKVASAKLKLDAAFEQDHFNLARFEIHN